MLVVLSVGDNGGDVNVSAVGNVDLRRWLVRLDKIAHLLNCFDFSGCDIRLRAG